MKKNNLLFLTGISILMSCATIRQAPQTILHGYAYQQPVSGGAAPGHVMDEQGHTLKMPQKESVTYYIYLETPAEVSYTIQRVWINHKTFTAEARPIDHTPVIITPDPMIPSQKDTLVPRTNNQVWLLDLKGDDATPGKTGNALEKKVAENAVVIEYKWNDATYYHFIPQIKKLPVAALQ